MRRGHTVAEARQQWKQQIFCYSDLTAKRLATEAMEDKDIEQLSRADVVAYKSPLMPVRDAVPLTESQMSLGTYWFDHLTLEFDLNFYLEREMNALFCLYFLYLPDLDAATEFSALEEISDEEAVRIYVPSAMPPDSISLRDYVDQSETLSKLVQLGN